MKHTTYEKIEELRLLMHEVASDKELTDQRVVSVSEKLDLLINEFYTAKKGSTPLPCDLVGACADITQLGRWKQTVSGLGSFLHENPNDPHRRSVILIEVL